MTVDDIDPAVCPVEYARVRKRLGQLHERLERFRVEHAAAGTDEPLRFEVLCQHMFQTFACSDHTAAPAPLSNLDTGDAIAHPYPAFIDALGTEVTRATADAHRYYGAESITELATAVEKFLRREGFPGPAALPRLRILPGAGAVHIYDALCKVLVRQPGDTVLVPRLGYGFFLTQPGRASGRVAGVDCDGRGAVKAHALAAAVAAENERLWREWRRDAPALFERTARNLPICGVGRVPPDASVLRDIRARLEVGPDEWRSGAVWRQLGRVAPELAAPAVRERALARLRPPRVVALLHIQPAVSGHVYSTAEIADLSTVLEAARVAVIEDVAYHSIRCRLRDLATMHGVATQVYTLIGVSKPMAVANMRLGLLLVEDRYYERPHRALESSAGYVSSLLQRTLATALAADGYDDYTATHSWGPDGYEDRRRVMHALLTGAPATDDTRIRALVEAVASTEQELEPFGPGLLREGLRRWLTPLVEPTAGFFQLVTCAPALQRTALRSLGVTSSFDMFALLAQLFNVRTIPEESMGPGQRPGIVLRLAFSPDPPVLAQLLLTAYRGLILTEHAARARLLDQPEP